MTCEDIETVAEECRTCVDDLAANPFVALRVAYGMLLGEDDFRVLAGNSRGKQMLHAAWLHRSGVVWGFDVELAGTRELKVTPGLAIDGWGRELIQYSTWCANLEDWVKEHPGQSGEHGCEHRTVKACVQIEFDCCLSDPVPTLAEPCDVTRKYDDYSRIVETSKLSLRDGCCGCGTEPYHRVRALLGIDRVDPGDEAGWEALAARERVAKSPAGERPTALLDEFRNMAVLDGVEMRPWQQSPTSEPTHFPVSKECAPVPLACVEIDIREQDGCIEICEVRIHRSCRRVLLPTRTIEEIVCGLAPGLIGQGDCEDAGGPRVDPDSIKWSGYGMRCEFNVTADVNPHSLRRAISMTSLPEGKGWVSEDIEAVKFDAQRRAVVIEMADRPINELVRLIVKGTGPNPVMGTDPAMPLAGVVGGSPGTVHDGHDAVIMMSHPLTPSETEAAQ